jgi:hypothetical protein
MYYKCIFFNPKELVDKRTFDQFGDKIWMFFNSDVLRSLDGIRSYFNKPVTVNNWHLGGEFSNRGLRPFYVFVGGDYSQHRFGNGFDCDVEGVPANIVRHEILTHKDDPHFKLITCLETDIVWVHFDCRNIPDRIRLVQP